MFLWETSQAGRRGEQKRGRKSTEEDDRALPRHSPEEERNHVHDENEDEKRPSDGKQIIHSLGEERNNTHSLGEERNKMHDENEDEKTRPSDGKSRE